MEAKELRIHNFSLFMEGGNYIDCAKLYYAYFQIVPTIKTIRRIDTRRLSIWLEKEWSEKIIKKHARQRYDWAEKQIRDIDLFYLLDNNLLLNLENNSVTVLHNQLQDDLAKDLLLQFKKFSVRERKTQEISLVYNGFKGLDTTALKIKKPVLDLTTYYNDDLLPLHKKILHTLKQKGKSGLYLFHGMPGTGKSTYIRYLIRSINKKVIFLPPGMAGNLDSPNLAKPEPKRNIT